MATSQYHTLHCSKLCHQGWWLVRQLSCLQDSGEHAVQSALAALQGGKGLALVLLAQSEVKVLDLHT